MNAEAIQKVLDLTTEAIEKVLRTTGLASRDPKTDEAVAEALNELANVRFAVARIKKEVEYAPFQKCCGGSDETPPQHTQDCHTREPAPVKSP
jgi:hypothetical protein